MHDICSSLIVSMCVYVPSYYRGEDSREYMVCINTYSLYSLVKKVCVEHASYILSALPLILSYRRKNVIRFEGIGYASNEGLSWQGLCEDVSHVEACRYMMYVDVSFLQVILEPFNLEVDMLGS